MAQWVADNVTEVAIVGQWVTTQPVVNVIHVRREEDDPEESARDVLNNWQDHMMTYASTRYVIFGARFVDHNEEVGATGFVLRDEDKPIQGVLTGEPLPPNCAMLVHKRISAHVGKRAGRMYLPAFVEDSVTDAGTIAGGSLAVWNTALGNFYSGLSGPSDNRLCVVHKPTAEAPTTSISLVTGLDMDPMMASQRRRLR